MNLSDRITIHVRPRIKVRKTYYTSREYSSVYPGWTDQHKCVLCGLPPGKHYTDAMICRRSMGGSQIEGQHCTIEEEE